MLKAIGFYISTFHYLVGFDRRAEKCATSTVLEEKLQ